MKDQARNATLVGIAGNAFLFVLKFVTGILTGSLAIFSDAINSFSDMIYSIAVYIAVKVSHKKADKDHPFGHHRAEPVAGMLIAIVTGILGFEIIKTGVMGLIEGQSVYAFTSFGAIILLACMAIKTGMWFYFKSVSNRINSPAIQASSIDSRNDVLISFSALIGISGPLVGINNLDYFVAIFIGLFVIRSAYRIGIENVDYLMGKTPDKEIMDEICKKVCSVDGVLGVHEPRAHYVGNYIQVQVHVEVDHKLHTDKAHAIGKKVQNLIEAMPSVDTAFIHIDPR